MNGYGKLRCGMSLALIGIATLVSGMLSGCSSPALAVASIALEASGLKKPDVSELQKPPRKVSISLTAGKNLNSDDHKKPLALVVRIYKLKDTASFYQQSFDRFVNFGTDKSLLGEDIIESREITLLPDQRYTWVEMVPRTANAIAIVALFHSPQMHRWRFAFDASEVEKTGVVMGAHSCALTVTQGAVIDTPTGIELARHSLNLLETVKCSSSTLN